MNGLPGLSNWAGGWKWKVNSVNWLKSRSRWDLLINYHTKVTDNHPAFKPLGVKWLNRPLLLITWTEIRAKHTVINFYWAFLESGTKGGWIGQSGQRVKFGTVPQKTGRLAAIQRVSRWADFAKNCLPWTENKGYCGEQISRKIVSRGLGPRSFRDFAKNTTLLGAKKMGSNMPPWYIQFRNIHDRDISEVHWTKLFIHENTFQSIVCEMAAILSMGDELIQCQ